MKRFLLAALIGLLVGNLALAQTATKGQIGADDINLTQTDGAASETFTRRTSTGGTITLDKLDGDDIPWSNEYTRTIRPGTLIVKESPWVDVRAYGAVGDGVTDDTAAFQAAITAAQATGRPVFVPDNVFKITSTLTAPGLNPVRIFGVNGVPYYEGPSDNSTYLPYGSRIWYTGTGACIKALSGRSVTIEDIVINGPGIHVDNSIGIHVDGSMGLSLRNVKIRNFDIGVQTGATLGNGDTNLFINCGIIRCNIGIYITGNQNYINTIIQCQIYAGICVKAINSTPVTIIGGQYSPYYPVTLRKYWQTTVTGVAGNVVTVASATNAATGMNMLIQHNAYQVDNYAPSYQVPLSTISSVVGNDITVPLASGNTVGVGDNVAYGWFPTAFSFALGVIINAHIEPPVNEDGSYIGAMLLNVPISAGGGLIVSGNFVNISAMASPSYPPPVMTKMLPFIHHEKTASLGSILTVEGNYFQAAFPTIETVGYATFRGNNWSHAPHFIGNDGAPANGVTIEKDTAHWFWGSNHATSVAYIDGWPGFNYSKWIGTGGTFPIIRVGEYAGVVPTAAMQEEFFMARAGAGSNFIGWKNREATGGAYGYYTTATLTTLGTTTVGSTTVTSSNLNSGGDTLIRPGMEINIPGAGGGGATLRSTIMFINGYDNTIHIRNNASTAVTDAAIAAIAPNMKTYGRQNHFGTAAPTTGTWAVGDITWNTGADNVVLWKCTVAGTPGTWQALTGTW